MATTEEGDTPRQVADMAADTRTGGAVAVVAVTGKAVPEAMAEDEAQGGMKEGPRQPPIPTKPSTNTNP